jgi:hypothetical protein
MGLSLPTKFLSDRMDNRTETLQKHYGEQPKKLNDELDKIKLELAQAQEELNSKRMALAR